MAQNNSTSNSRLRCPNLNKQTDSFTTFDRSSGNHNLTTRIFIDLYPVSRLTRHLVGCTTPPRGTYVSLRSEIAFTRVFYDRLDVSRVTRGIQILLFLR